MVNPKIYWFYRDLAETRLFSWNIWEAVWDLMVISPNMFILTIYLQYPSSPHWMGNNGIMHTQSSSSFARFLTLSVVYSFTNVRALINTRPTLAKHTSTCVSHCIAKCKTKTRQGGFSLARWLARSCVCARVAAPVLLACPLVSWSVHTKRPDGDEPRPAFKVTR